MPPLLFEDPQLLVCVKAPGLLSQDGGEASLPGLLRRQCRCEIYPVHRLDREAGGVMVYAKTRPAAAALSAAIQEKKLEKEYLCVTLGIPAEPQGTYRDLLLHDKLRNKSFVVRRMRGGVKEASLSYRVLEERDGEALVLVSLHTGRTHQIRVHLASIGHPLLGDTVYGSKKPVPGLAGQCLHARRLMFRHPRTGERVELECPLPDWFQEVLDKLERMSR